MEKPLTSASLDAGSNRVRHFCPKEDTEEWQAAMPFIDIHSNNRNDHAAYDTKHCCKNQNNLGWIFKFQRKRILDNLDNCDFAEFSTLLYCSFSLSLWVSSAIFSTTAKTAFALSQLLISFSLADWRQSSSRPSGERFNGRKSAKITFPAMTHDTLLLKGVSQSLNFFLLIEISISLATNSLGDNAFEKQSKWKFLLFDILSHQLQIFQIMWISMSTPSLSWKFFTKEINENRIVLGTR